MFFFVFSKYKNKQLKKDMYGFCIYNNKRPTSSSDLMPNSHSTKMWHANSKDIVLNKNIK